MKLRYGTKNLGKIQHMKSINDSIPFVIEGIDHKLIDVEETGKHNYENAKLKAMAYYKQLKAPVFSCDSGLYFDEVKEEEQPGVLIRRINNKRLTDEEMITYYSELANKYGGKLTARYRNAIALVVTEDIIHEYSGDDIASEPFYIVSKAHDKRTEGFPLDSLSVEIESGEYYNDKKASRSVSSKMNIGFSAFFNRVFKRPLVKISFKGYEAIEIQLYPEHAPETTKNFIELINKGYYNNKSLCRSVPKRLIQSGDTALETKAWTDDTPGYILDGEFNREGFKNSLSFKAGTLGMAMASYKFTPYATAGSFFIMTVDEEKLDSIVPAFGRVIKGMEVVHALNDLETHMDYGYDSPLDVVAIEHIEVDTFGFLYESPVKVNADVLKN